MHRFILPVAVLALTLTAADASGQRFTADLRGGFAMPTQKLSGADLDPGPSIGATVAVRLQPHLHVYGGWDWVHFSADQSFAGASQDFEETGYTFGLRFEHPFRETSRAAYRLEAGGTYKHIEIENGDGDRVANSGHGLGYEAGGSVLVPLTGAWRLVPGIRYRSLSREFSIGSAKISSDLRYAAFELGVSRRF